MSGLTPNTHGYNYSSFTAEELNNYFNETIGDYAEQLKSLYFTDAANTNYLDALKYTTNLVWNVPGKADWRTGRHQLCHDQ